ncbi:MAG: site-specific DNA-methyltransferase [Acidobacteria bacterium]|nr:MAG: site-specific DNA-methyltransferase [Acidobacteriota bacterium]
MTVSDSLVDLGASNDYVICSDNALALPHLPESSFRLIYIDPPFNTSKEQRRNSITVERVGDGQDDGDRTGFGGHRYRTTQVGSLNFSDSYDDYLEFIAPRLVEARRLLTEDGTLYFHIDYRESHYCKVLLDEIFGRDCFLNEIVWAYDYGGRPKRRWPAKHDTILVYVRDPKLYYFDQEAIDRIPYMAPELAGPEKAARGKTPTDVWWHTIVSPTGKEKTGYPTQKPEGVLRRAIQASSSPGDWVLDFFAGSGTTGAVARALGRRFVLIDSNPEAFKVMKKRLGDDRISYLDLARPTSDKTA